MNNTEIAHAFQQMADLLELQGENAFRVRAYRAGAKAILELPRGVKDILADPAETLQSYAGIGDTLAEKCRLLVETGKLPQLEELREAVPAVLLQMTRIPGLGAKKALMLQRQLNLRSLDDLRQACEQQRVRVLKGFAAKTEEQILAGLEIANQVASRLRIDQAERLVERLREHLISCESVEQIEFAGSYRRGKETVGDIDILVISHKPQAVMEQLESFPGRATTLARGDTKMSIRVEAAFQVDLRVVAAESFGAALQYFTGSKEHNVALRSRAKKLGLTVNEYGITRLDDGQVVPASATEQQFYEALGLRWIPPELREGRMELQWAESIGGWPDLVELSDIVGDLHSHTTDSDGSHSISQMAQAARALGLQYLAITDHSQRVSMARGLDSQRLHGQWSRVEELNRQSADNFRILKGVECDILEAGPLDIDDATLSEADWVVASVHYGQKQSQQQITDRIVGALKNPHVDIVAHPTGRLLGSRPAYAVDIQAVIQAAAEFRKALELNASPYRLDLCEQHLLLAAAAGVPIAISTDAHSTDGLLAMRYGIVQGRRAGLLRHQVLNTWPLSKLLTWLARN